ncbi:MAG TPA: serine hydrolase [Myxococcales bacterium]
MHALIPLLASALGAALVPFPAQTPEIPFPTREWPEAPSATGSPLSLTVEQAFADPDPKKPLRTHAVLVVHRGRLVAERYGPAITAGTRLPGWSAAKTVTAILAGILVGQGKLSLDGPTRVPAWAPPDPRSAITLEHLLRMTGGQAWREDYYDPMRSEVLTMLLGDGRHDMAAFAESRPLAATPGSKFVYSCGSTLVVSKELRRALPDDEAYRAFPRQALFDPLGMKSALFETDGAGTIVGSSYFVATARDFARVGLLLLRGGQWDGKRILPEGFVDRMRTPTPASRNGEYGAGVWLRPNPDLVPPMTRVPLDTFYASGKDGQYVVVVPSRDLVIVRLGTTPLDGRLNLGQLIGGIVDAVP